MTSEVIPAACIPRPNPLPEAEDLAAPRLALMLMHDLEASLHTSQKALLALDLAGIERGTREQVALIRKLEAALRRNAAPSASERRPGEDEARSLPAGVHGLEEELRLRRNKIREACRLQLALLVRARARLRVLANMLAGPSVNYESLLTRSSAPPAFGWKSGERSDSCQV